MIILITNMLLKRLIKNCPLKFSNLKISGLASDSRKVKKGFIFFAINGQKTNGEKYINDAIKKGAVVIVCKKNSKYFNKKIYVTKTNDIRLFLSEISSKFYNLKPKNIIAVTGTNGKTSVADLFYQILSLNKIPVASIGTLGIKYKKKLHKSHLTCPDTITLHKSLEVIKKNNIDHVIIEASSHGLHQRRIANLNFKAGIFTNFSQDHLDYHKNMKSYLNAKLLLCKEILTRRNYVIYDKFVKQFSPIKKIAKKKNLKLIDISEIKKKINKIPNLRLKEFQIKNLSMAISAAKLCNLKEKKIFKTLEKIKDVNGRLELVKVFPNNIKTYVDFAHTPDALLKSINALMSEHNKKISLVFGCGGDRDFKKRPLMGKIASSKCNKIFVTDDNPRNENPEKIRKEILRSIKNKNSFNIGNRTLAIKTAILLAGPNEVILVAGKGHEEEQIYKDKVISISDKQIIKNLNLKIKKLSNKKQNFLENKNIISKITQGYKTTNFHGLSIDSREIKKDNIFLTIKGKKNDGSKFISEALSKGAKYIVSSKSNKIHKSKILKVKSEYNFLKKFAELKRKKTKAKILAITGSAGKTSLKNLLKDILQNFGKTLCSPKSYNNHYGVPLSLSQLQNIHEYGVFELGMSRAGEIDKLSKLVKPHIGIITNIGEAHIENFKNLKGIANAKAEIINNVQKGGTIILNRDDKFFNLLKRKAKLRNLNIFSFGKNKKSDMHPISIKKNEKNITLTINFKNEIFKLHIKDLNIYNVLCSLALIKVLNLELKKIYKLYRNFAPTEGRGRIHKIKRYKKNFKLIDESYNANPLSVKNAIINFSSIKKRNFKKYLLLGDMLELGNKSENLHKDLSKVINNSDIDKVFIKGSKALITYKNIQKNKRGNIFQQEEDVDFTLNNIIANNDYLMIKGSNATGLNNLSKKIIKGY